MTRIYISRGGHQQHIRPFIIVPYDRDDGGEGAMIEDDFIGVNTIAKVFLF